jgi:hypothetical protein
MLPDRSTKQHASAHACVRRDHHLADPECAVCARPESRLLRLPSAVPTQHLVIITHTPRSLRRVLIGAARQSDRAANVVVSCDTDDPAIADVVERSSAELGLPVVLVQRPHTGKSRSAQARNNGVRALMSRGIADPDRLVFIDGDCFPTTDFLRTHARRGAGERLVVGFRIDLTPEQTESFDEPAALAGRAPAAPTAEQLASLAARHRRYARHAWLRAIGLVKDHKPKVLSANFSVPLGRYREINGFDEEFEGYGGEDDDLGRRLYRSGVKPAVAVKDAMVYHLWHPTRAAANWEDSPGVKRFRTNLPVRAVLGLDQPLGQGPVRTDVFGGKLC